MDLGAISIRWMTPADVSMAMVLKTEAGWNQVEADWVRFLDMQPDGCFVAELDGEPVGTTVTCVFDDVAWVAMVLVAKRARGQGIGTALVEHALKFLESKGVQTVRLDATPLGQSIYEKLGFAPEYPLARYGGRLGSMKSDAESSGHFRLRAANERDHQPIVALDCEVTGTLREKFLGRLFHERMVTVRVAVRSQTLLGYFAVRSGSGATQLGPCIGTIEAAQSLLSQAGGITTKTKGVYIDVPTQCDSMVRLVEKAGLRIQRKFVRMCRGPRVREDAKRLLASSGPELG
jgi:GNAT superfamily N-acetyltransferase